MRQLPRRCLDLRQCDYGESYCQRMARAPSFQPEPVTKKNAPSGAPELKARPPDGDGLGWRERSAEDCQSEQNYREGKFSRVVDGKHLDFSSRNNFRVLPPHCAASVGATTS